MLYSKLFKAGIDNGINPDSLISVYCLIKSAKEGKDRIRPIECKNGRKITKYRLLHKVTGLSEKTLKKYVPYLIEEGVFNFSKDGSAYLKGNTKTAKEYKRSKTIKLTVEPKLSDMNLNVYFVRIKAKERRQINIIDKNNSKIKTMSRFKAGKYVPLKEQKWALKQIQEGKLEKINHDKVVLSNEGYYLLKKGINDKKSAGNYWKNKLRKAEKIYTRRNNKFIKRCTKTEYFACKIVTKNPRLNYYNGSMWEETVCEFSTTPFPAKKKITKSKEPKPKDYLQFDMIAWWMEGDK